MLTGRLDPTASIQDPDRRSIVLIARTWHGKTLRDLLTVNGAELDHEARGDGVEVSRKAFA